MLNIPITSAVTWTSPPTGSPVPAVPAIQPVGAAGRDRQAGPDAGQDGQLPARPGSTARTARGGQAGDQPVAPLLPNAAGATSETGERAGAADEPARQESEQTSAQQEADKAMRARLQAVLTTVWQASASVVERALGRESANDAAVGAVSSASDPSDVGAALLARRPLPPEPASRPQVEPLPWPIMDGDAPVQPEDIVAYDEKGNSTLMPLEVGQLVNQRV
ncbi:MAG: hypothetical protein R3E94_15790 [Burkholderiaceae bacterium]